MHFHLIYIIQKSLIFNSYNTKIYPISQTFDFKVFVIQYYLQEKL